MCIPLLDPEPLLLLRRGNRLIQFVFVRNALPEPLAPRLALYCCQRRYPLSNSKEERVFPSGHSKVRSPIVLLQSSLSHGSGGYASISPTQSCDRRSGRADRPLCAGWVCSASLSD